MTALNDRMSAPITRAGSKGKNAMYLLHHFAKAHTWIEPFFGAGSVFFQLPRGVYDTFIVNDIHSRLVSFFRVLRDQPRELARLCSLSPYAIDDFEVACVQSDDPLEDARRFWVLSRFNFGASDVKFQWSRASPKHPEWAAVSRAQRTVAYMELYGRALNHVQITNQTALSVISRYGMEGHCFIYADPPYISTSRLCECYAAEMSEQAHIELLTSLTTAARNGAKVAISGYRSEIYEDMLDSWRRVEYEVRVGGFTQSMRTEVLWLSYPKSDEIGSVVIAPQSNPKTPSERALLKQARHRR